MKISNKHVSYNHLLKENFIIIGGIYNNNNNKVSLYLVSEKVSIKFKYTYHKTKK